MPNVAEPGAVTWTNILIGANFDPYNDPQAQSAGTDLVGNAANAMLQGYRAGTGSTDGTTVYYFRARVDQDPGGVSFYLGLDATGDGIADIFVEAKVAANDGLTLSYHVADAYQSVHNVMAQLGQRYGHPAGSDAHRVVYGCRGHWQRSRGRCQQ